jgi:hypothetical protein
MPDSNHEQVGCLLHWAAMIVCQCIAEAAMQQIQADTQRLRQQRERCWARRVSFDD